ncbi:hypothetical protein IT408_04700 [Candidatus Uhrbacteria bacterium]|nr:hypothetical protein [Candidatus Uhrbacteria bacterium]
MEDISSKEKSLDAMRKKICVINAKIQNLDEYDDEIIALRDERGRLFKYMTFVESVLDDVVTAMQAAVAKLLQQQTQPLKAKVEAPVAAVQPKTASHQEYVTPQNVEAMLIELCHGKIRSISTRYASARRVMELIHFGTMKTPHAIEDINEVIHDFVRETIEHDRYYDDVKNASGAAWSWMKNTFHALANEHRKVNGPIGFYSTGPMEAATTEDIERYSSVDAKIDYYAHFMGIMLRELPKAVSEEDLSRVYDLAESEANVLIKKHPHHVEIINKCLDAACDDLYNRSFNSDHQEQIYQALCQLQSMLNPWFDTWTGPIVERQIPKSKKEKGQKSGSIPLSPPSGRFENDALRRQLTQVLRKIEDGNVPTAQA